MNLKKIRLSGDITQQEASMILGVPLRTYIRYENDEKYKKSLKYQKMCDLLEEKFRIDEEHGVLTFEQIKNIVNDVFKKYNNIEFAFLFGSYAKEKAVPMSDVNIMICTDPTGLDFFGLIEELREALHKKVDLIAFDDIKQGSKLMLEILRTGRRIYEKQ